MHCPVTGFVSHRKTFTGRIAAPVSADAMIFALAPTFTVATAKTPVPVAPGTSTMPPLAAASATMSGTGVAEAENNSVFSPELTGAGLLFVQSKLSCTSVGGKGAVGVKASTKLCAAPPATLTAVFGVPVIWLVAELVVW